MCVFGLINLVLQTVLFIKQTSAGVNGGLKVVNNTHAYEQVRDAFSYFYPKRKDLADGVSTSTAVEWVRMLKPRARDRARAWEWVAPFP